MEYANQSKSKIKLLVFELNSFKTKIFWKMWLFSFIQFYYPKFKSENKMFQISARALICKRDHDTWNIILIFDYFSVFNEQNVCVILTPVKTLYPWRVKNVFP